MEKVTIVYASSLMSKNALDKCFEVARDGVGLEIQKYHRLLAEGFVSNESDIEIISYHPFFSLIDSAAKNEIENNIKYNYVVTSKKHFVHLDVVKRSYKIAKSILKNKKNAYVICDVLNYSVALGTVLAAKKTKTKTIGIITDFPEGSHPKGSMKIPLIWNLIKKFDSYIVLTKQMLDKLNQKKPSLILEGQADIKIFNNPTTSIEKSNDFVCLYAGSVHERYGIANLVNGFIKADIPNSKLIIYGGGDYAEKLKNISDKRIDYRGVASNDLVVKEEQKATLLVNPRPTNDSYVLYSFPSKTMEYMSTGTATLTTKLAGIPEEYFEYIYAFDDFDENSIAKKLTELSLIDREELILKGNKAREFVKTNKSNISQTKKILDFIFNNLR